MTENRRRTESICGDSFLGLFCLKFNPNGLEKTPGSASDTGLRLCGSGWLDKASKARIASKNGRQTSAGSNFGELFLGLFCSNFDAAGL